MTGLELLRAADTTADEIVDIVTEHCPPVTPDTCDRLSCRTCWLAWLTTGEPPKEKGPSDERTAPGEEGLHPNLAEYLRREKRVQRIDKAILNRYMKNEPASPHPHGAQDGRAGTP